MPVLVMNVRKVPMAVTQRVVMMFMSVRFGSVPLIAVLMLVMLIMHVCVRVRQRLMHVLVLVVLSDVQPDAEPH